MQRAFLRAKFDEYLSDGYMPELLEEKRKQTYINTLFNNILKDTKHDIRAPLRKWLLF